MSTLTNIWLATYLISILNHYGFCRLARRPVPSGKCAFRMIRKSLLSCDKHDTYAGMILSDNSIEDYVAKMLLSLSEKGKNKADYNGFGGGHNPCYFKMLCFCWMCPKAEHKSQYMIRMHWQKGRNVLIWLCNMLILLWSSWIEPKLTHEYYLLFYNCVHRDNCLAAFFVQR